MKIKLLNHLIVLLHLLSEISATTHWVVTENGKIQSRLNSPFHMRRPDDLLAFLEQDVWPSQMTQIYTMYQNLLLEKIKIDEKWPKLEEATDIEARLYAEDTDCLRAGRQLSVIDLYASMVVVGSDRDGIKLSDFLVELSPSIKTVTAPECQDVVKLDYSMFTFEHLSGMINRVNLTIAPETALLDALQGVMKIEQLGHNIAIGLKTNTTSWFHYNLGAIYWRIRGNAFKAIECGRRAVYFAPREYRDIALFNLANIFHQAKYSGEAALILHAAVDHAPHEAINHYSLGNIYAALADYNRSLTCFENSIKLNPEFEPAYVTKHAILCHKKLENKLIELHESLQNILAQLYEYHSQQNELIKMQEKFIKDQSSLDKKLLNFDPKNTFKNILAMRGQTCSQKGDDSKLTCEFNSFSQVLSHVQLDINLSLQVLLNNVESQVQRINEQVTRNAIPLSSISKRKFDANDVTNQLNHLVITENKIESNFLTPRYPADFEILNTINVDAITTPSEEQCKLVGLSQQNFERKYQIYLPPENKGFPVKSILSTLIDLPYDFEHPLPWYPPLCAVETPLNENISKYFKPYLYKTTPASAVTDNSYLSKHFFNYVNEERSVQAEIGQRILTAARRKAGPEWLLAILSSLYWRTRSIQSNLGNALDCLKLSLSTVPDDYRDVPLVSLGAIMYELGYLDDALKVAEEAFHVNAIEPETNFLLAVIYVAKGNKFFAAYYLQRIIQVNINHRNGEAEKMLRFWACESNKEESNELTVSEEQMCPGGEIIHGEGVLCSENGRNCKTAAIHCYRAEKTDDDEEEEDEDEFMTLDSVPISKLLAEDKCEDKGELNSMFNSLWTAYTKNENLIEEVSDSIELDQAQLENMDTKHLLNAGSFGDVYMLSDESKTMLHVFDKSGAYPLSSSNCDYVKIADWITYTTMWWQSVSTREESWEFMSPAIFDKINVAGPYCDKMSALPDNIDVLTVIKENNSVDVPEPKLSVWLAVITGDYQSIQNIGKQIAVALKKNSTSWLFSTAAGIYWQILGNTLEAVRCFRRALLVAPDKDKDVPLLNLANLFHRIGNLEEALQLSKMALDIHPEYIVNQFTVGNIYSAMEKFSDAVQFYKLSLHNSKFETAARNKIRSIMCSIMFDESGTLSTSFTDLGK